MKKRTFLTLSLLMVVTLGQKAFGWTQTGKLPNTDSVLHASTVFTIDGNGNSYYAGEFYRANSNSKGFALWKYDRFGVFQGITDLKLSTSNSIIAAADLEVISGNLYVLLRTRKTASPFDEDLALFRYSLALVKSWENSFSGGGNGFDESPLGITNGNNATVQIGVNGNSGVHVVRYNKSNGNQSAATFFKTGNTRLDVANLIFHDGVDTYIAGRNVNPTTGNGDMFIVKYDSLLALKWNRLFDASGTSLFDEAISIASDGAGNILVGGNFISSNGLPRTFYTKYNDVNGNRFWVRRMTNDEFGLVGLFANSSNNIIAMAGNVDVGYRGHHIDGATGNILANKLVLNKQAILSEVVSLAKGTGDDFYFMASFDSTYTLAGTTQNDRGVMIGRVNSSANRVWDRKISNDLVGYEILPVQIQARGGSTLMYLANVTDPSIPKKTTYAQFGRINVNTGLRMSDSEGTSEAEKLTIYPNPASHEARFISEIIRSRFGDVTLFDIKGSVTWEGRVWFDDTGNSEPIPLDRQATGIYFLRLSSDGQTWTRKIQVN